jgi:murein peptide amidase A
MTAGKALALLLSVLLLASTGPAVSEAASKRPAVVETRVIGHTVKGRDIVAWRVGQPSSGRRVVVLSAMHGNEIGPKRILVNRLDGRRIRGADIWLVPQYNRDGVVRRTRQPLSLTDR